MLTLDPKHALASIAAALLPLTACAQADADKAAYLSAGCYQCHGTVGQGGVGPRLAPQPLPLGALTAFVRNSPRNMPAYGPGVLSDAELRRIFDYLSAQPASPPPAAIAELATPAGGTKR